MLTAPGKDDYAPFYAGYIARVAESDVLRLLSIQAGEMRQMLGHLPADRGGYRYAPDKWSIRDIIQHLSDAERIFAVRALRIARGDQTPLPGWDEGPYALAAHAERLSVAVLLDDWEAARRSTVSMFQTFDDQLWDRRGVANDNPVTPRAIAFILAGHTAHHVAILRERYGVK